jgi:hypothetical protein
MKVKRKALSRQFSVIWSYLSANFTGKIVEVADMLKEKLIILEMSVACLNVFDKYY